MVELGSNVLFAISGSVPYSKYYRERGTEIRGPTHPQDFGYPLGQLNPPHRVSVLASLAGRRGRRPFAKNVFGRQRRHTIEELSKGSEKDNGVMCGSSTSGSALAVE